MIVWLASYPRSGNTFLRILLKAKFGLESYSIYGDKRDIARNEQLSNIVGHQDISTIDVLEELQADNELHVVKTHDLPPERYDKAIYVVREGRDSCISYTRYLRDYSDVDASFLDVAAGNVPFGTWSEHVRIWRLEPKEKVLFLSFSELTSQPEKLSKVIAEFLGVPLLPNPIPDFDDLKALEPNFFRSGGNSRKQKRNRRDLTETDRWTFWLFNETSMQAEGFGNDKPLYMRTPRNRKLFKEVREFIESLLITMNQNEQTLAEQIHESRQVIHNRNKIINARNAHIEEVKQLILSKQKSSEEKQMVIDQKLRREKDLLRLIRQNEEKLTNAEEKYEAKLRQLEDMREIILRKQDTIDELNLEIEELTSKTNTPNSSGDEDGKPSINIMDNKNETKSPKSEINVKDGQ